MVMGDVLQTVGDALNEIVRWRMAAMVVLVIECSFDRAHLIGLWGAALPAGPVGAHYT